MEAQDVPCRSRDMGWPTAGDAKIQIGGSPGSSRAVMYPSKASNQHIESVIGMGREGDPPGAGAGGRSRNRVAPGPTKFFHLAAPAGWFANEARLAHQSFRL